MPAPVRYPPAPVRLSPSSARSSLIADDFEARRRAIARRILDAIDLTLDDLAGSGDDAASHRAALADAVWAEVAPRLCRQALCRRSKRCRRRPCAVSRLGFGAGRGASGETKSAVMR